MARMVERNTVDHAALTDVGRKRQHNEDAYRCVPEDDLFLVADGMGGHNAGEVASRMAVDLVSEFFAESRRDPPVHWPYKLNLGESHDAETLSIAVQYANLRIFESARENADRRGMGTTFVGALLRGNVAWVAHVGDSRGYVIRASGVIEPLTIDHSLLEEYRRTRPDLTDDQLKKFPYKNVVTRALGMKTDVCVELHRHELRPGDSARPGARRVAVDALGHQRGLGLGAREVDRRPHRWTPPRRRARRAPPTPRADTRGASRRRCTGLSPPEQRRHTTRQRRHLARHLGVARGLEPRRVAVPPAPVEPPHVAHDELGLVVDRAEIGAREEVLRRPHGARGSRRGRRPRS
jgi:serine/threonine protein phosphatase PrpC